MPNFLLKKGPLFDKQIYVTSPTLPTLEEVIPKMSQMLERKWVTNFGIFHNQLEQMIRDILGVKYVVMCCNGTVALFLLLKALGLKGKIITTPFTFPATVHAISMAGLEPLFCDIDPDDYLIDPSNVEHAVSPDVYGIVAVNVFGSIANVDKLEEIGARQSIPVVYDSAHAFLGSYQGKFVGGFGAAEMFSFHGTKLFTTLEGGAITTNNEEIFRKLKLLINFGIQDEEHVVSIGLNGKMSEVNAIFGLLSLQKRDCILDKLSKLFSLYKERLFCIPGIKLQRIREGYKPNYQYMPVRIIPDEFGMGRNQLHRVLREDNIITRKYFFPPVHKYDCYRDEKFSKAASLHNAEMVADQILCLPIYPNLEMENVEKICGLIESVHSHASEILKEMKGEGT